MKVRVPDYTGDAPGGLIDVNIADAPIQKFLNWLLSANRYTFENNPDVTIEKVSRLRLALTAESRKGERVEEREGSAEITIAGLLALCDCATVEELVDVVAQSRRGIEAVDIDRMIGEGSPVT